MKKHYDVIVVGGGVIGGAIAYYSVQKQKSVLLLESNEIGSGTSQAAAGMLGAQSEMNELGPLFQLALKSRSMFPQLAEELKECSGIDIGLMIQGLLKVATSAEQAEHYLQLVNIQRQYGEVVEWLTGEEASKIEPLLGKKMYGAMYFPNEGQVLASSLNQAFVQGARRLGAIVREYTNIHSVIIEAGRAVGVVTSSGIVYGDQIVLATGNGSKTLLEAVGIQLDLYPVKGECFSVISQDVVLNTTIFSEGCYLVPKQGGKIVVGATMRERSYDRTVSMSGMLELLDNAVRLLPSLANMSFHKTWSGLRPQTPDRLPIMGAVPHIQGLYVATGHYRNGILLSPATGKGMAELLDKDAKHECGGDEKREGRFDVKRESGPDAKRESGLDEKLQSGRDVNHQISVHPADKQDNPDAAVERKQSRYRDIDLSPFGLERFAVTAAQLS